MYKVEYFIVIENNGSGEIRNLDFLKEKYNVESLEESPVFMNLMYSSISLLYLLNSILKFLLEGEKW